MQKMKASDNLDNKKRFSISKWIILALACILNVFIVVTSCLDSATTAKMNAPLSNFIAGLINTFTHKDVETVHLTNVDIYLDDQYKYNDLLGYKTEDIPLGSAKQIECKFNPTNATNKAITYSANPSDLVALNQSGSTLSIVGMKVGECVITATSNDGGLTSSVNVNIVETVAPVSYEISLDKNDIALGTTQTIKFDIDGGVLSHNELINFRYYDTRKLTYSSLDESIAMVDNYGVIYPQSVGSTSITVANGDYVKSLDISVSDGSMPTPYSNLSISGSNICYANDMILDQNSKKNHYQLTPKDGDNELSPEDFIWSSSNELLVKVDKHGVMRGFRKASNEDENAIITAKSKQTGQEVTFDVMVKNQLPTKMFFCLVLDEKEIYNPVETSISIGENIRVNIYYDQPTQVKTVQVECSNPEVLSVTNEGSNLILHPLKEGSCIVKMISDVNPDVFVSTKYTVIKAGAISSNDFDDFNHYIRKSFGHLALFTITQIFTFLAFYMFSYNRKWYVWTSMSLGEGLFIAGLSELIQFFVPGRGGSFLDVAIDFCGAIVGALLALLIIFIINKIYNKHKGAKKDC